MSKILYRSALCCAASFYMPFFKVPFLFCIFVFLGVRVGRPSARAECARRWAPLRLWSSPPVFAFLRCDPTLNRLCGIVLNNLKGKWDLFGSSLSELGRYAYRRRQKTVWQGVVALVIFAKNVTVCRMLPKGEISKNYNFVTTITSL